MYPAFFLHTCRLWTSVACYWHYLVQHWFRSLTFQFLLYICDAIVACCWYFHHTICFYRVRKSLETSWLGIFCLKIIFPYCQVSFSWASTLIGSLEWAMSNFGNVSYNSYMVNYCYRYYWDFLSWFHTQLHTYQEPSTLAVSSSISGTYFLSVHFGVITMKYEPCKQI